MALGIRKSCIFIYLLLQLFITLYTSIFTLDTAVKNIPADLLTTIDIFLRNSPIPHPSSLIPHPSPLIPAEAESRSQTHCLVLALKRTVKILDASQPQSGS